MNAPTTNSLTIPTELNHITIAMLSFVTAPFRLAGTDSAVLRDTKCPSPVSRSGVVVRMRQVGSLDVTLQWRMGLLVAESVIIG